MTVNRSAERKLVQKEMMWRLIIFDLFAFLFVMGVALAFLLIVKYVEGSSWRELFIVLSFLPALALPLMGLSVWFYHTDLHYPSRTYEAFGLPDPDDAASVEAWVKKHRITLVTH